MKPVNPMDMGFLLLERRNQPMHVGGLILAKPPSAAKGGGKAYVQNMLSSMLGSDEPQYPFNQRLHQRAGLWFWDEDHDFDIEAHVYHLSLPKPGRIRELLALISKLHSSLMDRSKPLWEVYIIEGVEGGRVAMYTKIHHALVDGVAAMRYMEKATSIDPEAEVIPLWALPPKPRGSMSPAEIATSPLSAMVQAASKVRGRAGSTRKVAQEVLKSIRSRKKDPDYVSVFQAPKTIFNKRISGGRRFAAQSWDMQRIKSIGKAHGATLNDVILAMCGSALRRYLEELNELPDKPLIAMVPVSMRTDDSEGGNQVAMILANLATDQVDPLERLATIKRSVNNSKERFSRMNQQEIMGYISTVMAVHGVNMALGINPGWQAFNIVISNVPGPRETLYWNGAKVEGVYPVSIAADGMALNITLTSYAGNLELGVIGCRRTLPHMQRLLQYLEDGLVELE